MKLYGYTIIANKDRGDIGIFHWSPGLCLAEDREAAEKIVKDTALSKFPKSDGYYCHNWDLVEAPPYFVASLIAQIKPPVVRRYDEDEVNWPQSID